MVRRNCAFCVRKVDIKIREVVGSCVECNVVRRDTLSPGKREVLDQGQTNWEKKQRANCAKETEQQK